MPKGSGLKSEGDRISRRGHRLDARRGKTQPVFHVGIVASCRFAF